MSQSFDIVNKQNERERISLDENIHPMTNNTLQSFVDDIPFKFNPKYQTIIVSNIDIPEYDTNQIRHVFSKSIDFTLENKVLLEALDDLKRKKKIIQSDTLRQQSSPPSGTVTTNYQLSDSSVIDTSIPVKSLPRSYHLPSVRDIYWPSSNQQQFHIPTLNNSSQLSCDSIKQTDHSFKNSNSIYPNDLADTFDGTLTSDDPFNDAELKSLNNVKELNHLYSSIGSDNTIRR